MITGRRRVRVIARWHRPAGGLRERRCLSARVTVNGRELPRFVPFVGWREYRLLVPRDTLHAGRNDVRFEITDAAGAPWRFAMTT